MHLRTLAAATVLLGTPVPAVAQRPSPAKQAVVTEVEKLSGEINRMAMTLWTYSETALKETRSAAFLADLAEKDGFTVERGVAGMPTAFVATWGSGSPVIGILAEYDALPGIGNEAVPERQPRADGTLGGQGCGHNLFGAGSVGAALALKRVMQAQGIKGTIKLYGTPAEETLIGKTYMARDGLFSGVDATLEWHPSTETAVGNTANQANNNFTVEFTGQPAHAAADPWNGRSALDAVELMTHAVNMMREHVRPTARVHYVIPSAGEAPNVVPAYAKVWFFVRDSSRQQVEDHYAWLLKIAEGAALATRTTHKVFLNTGVYEYLFNRPLQEAMQKNLEAVGAPKWAEAEHQFARSMQKVSGRPEKGMSTVVKPLVAGVEPLAGGSTDVSDVSWLNPTVGLEVATAGLDLPWHSWQSAASHGIPGASKAADVAAKVLAMTAVDLFTNPQLLATAKAEFGKQTAGRPYKSAIPEGQKPPLP
jgi:aminobenzoyl-glutamate utilization protein B